MKPAKMVACKHSFFCGSAPLSPPHSLRFSPLVWLLPLRPPMRLMRRAMPLAQTGKRHRSVCARGPIRVSCVVDGDTFWYRGLKIRIADINAPELSSPSCAHEARLAAAATRRLVALLNAGPFTLATGERETDRYGRALRVVLRGGRSLGAVLEAEGLAERWQGRRGDWCAA